MLDRIRRILRRDRRPPVPPHVLADSEAHIIESYFAENPQPLKCIGCDSRAEFALAAMDRQSFTCAEHLGEFIAIWTTAREITVVRL